MNRSEPPPRRSQALVAGAGLSGLSCAALLVERGVDVHVIEADDDVGGRIRTDAVDGFKLDRGFQVLLTAYDELGAHLDVDDLDLRAFRAGSMVWTGSRLETLGDPYRNPSDVISTLGARVGSVGDKMRIAALRRRLLATDPEECFTGPDRSTQEELEALGFSAAFIDAFFRPFLGGVFLDRDLETSAKLFRYYFRCFAAGDAAVPAQGMQRLPERLAAPLAGRISCRVRARDVSPTSVTLDDGSVLTARHVVLAADGVEGASLTGREPPATKAAVTSYWVSTEAPVSSPLLVLDGVGTGPVNHLAVMSSVSEAYAPDGTHLISASGIGEAAMDPRRFEAETLQQMERWFGEEARRWTLLRTYRIPHALPRHPAGSMDRGPRPARRPDGLFVAGDHTEFGSIQGALRSGRRAAEAILADTLVRSA
ncbi:MAG: NAD(P)/FAD-dependent oxidoreductase [Longimicrobiales bacterium]|nr:NAD(P)/FAD-dependent oxidoreductase [Longimicrobiales bacterium]